MSKYDKEKKEYYAFLNVLDPTGTNTKYYKEKFEKMSDTAFKRWVNEGHFRLFTTTSVVETSNEIALQACEHVGIKPVEKIALPHIHRYPDGTPLVTDKEIMILRVPLRRLQQTVSTENSASSSNTKRDKTNQVYGVDKSAQLSSDEVMALMGNGYDKVIVELLTMRADHSLPKREAYAELVKTGSCKIPESINDPKSKVALSYIDNLYLSAGVSTDLIESLEYR